MSENTLLSRVRRIASVEGASDLFHQTALAAQRAKDAANAAKNVAIKPEKRFVEFPAVVSVDTAGVERQDVNEKIMGHLGVFLKELGFRTSTATKYCNLANPLLWPRSENEAAQNRLIGKLQGRFIGCLPRLRPTQKDFDVVVFLASENTQLLTFDFVVLLWKDGITKNFTTTEEMELVLL